MGRENRLKNLQTCLNEQTNLCKLQSYKHVAINFKLPNKAVSKTLQSTVKIIHIKHRYNLSTSILLKDTQVKSQAGCGRDPVIPTWDPGWEWRDPALVGGIPPFPPGTQM